MKFTTIAAAALVLAGTAARAEIAEITIAQQFGVSFLPLMIMERDGLIEKHAKAAGIEVKTNWQKVAGPSVINDGLLSGNVHFGAVGAPSLVTLWWRTKSNAGVKGVAAMTSYPLYFVTRNPERVFTVITEPTVPKRVPRVCALATVVETTKKQRMQMHERNQTPSPSRASRGATSAPRDQTPTS